MSRRQLVEQALQTINQLPEDKISEVLDFASYILKKHEETRLQKGIEQLTETSSAFAFLHDEEDLYTLDDLKERFK
jgi:TorA maturation chaperone TorD